jgi:5-methylcytosine-specific restriction endonuclease McrA
MKTCKKCLADKAADQFTNDRSRKDGKYPYCKICVKSIAKSHYQNNREKILLKAAVFRNNNRQYLRQKYASYYLRNKETQKDAIKDWQKRNKHKLQEYATKRRSSLQAKVFRVSEKELQRLLSLPCCYCQTSSSDTIEHIIPLARGGSHGIGNLAGACRSCNSSKKDKTIMEFRLWKSNQIVIKMA